MYRIESIYDGNEIENYAIYKGDYNCIIETLAYTDFLKTVRSRDIKTLYNKCISLLYWYEYIDASDRKYDDIFTLQEQLEFIRVLENKENKSQLEKIYVKGKQKHAKGLSKETICIHMANIREYYEFLKGHNFIELKDSQIPFRKDLKIQLSDKKRFSLPETLTMDEVRILINACSSLRDKAIISLMVSTGLRLGELCALKIQSLDLKNNAINLRHQYLDLENGVLKTGERKLKVPSSVLVLLQKYMLLEREPVAICDNLFVTLVNRKYPAGRPLQRNSIQKMFMKLSKETHIGNCHAHVLRHTFATNFLNLKEKNDKISIEMLRKLMGHKHLSTTLIYTHLDYTVDDTLVGKDFEKFINRELSK